MFVLRNIDEITLNAGLSEFITESLKEILVGGYDLKHSVCIEEVSGANSYANIEMSKLKL